MEVLPAILVSLHGPRWIRSEATVTILTFLLGLTNGDLTSVLMILNPKSVLESEAEWLQSRWSYSWGSDCSAA
ncbi:hypothetical protein MLD38_006642 [Melastoma candidum]|uniref:Uncharacterized protein n=1 Tax=Melastoma candidum TaxID=119954 RepID=A0ACB9RRI8_9MYRT|nr:hypothetical protein MLD38_006642 [Melastoma candidum]